MITVGHTLDSPAMVLLTWFMFWQAIVVHEMGHYIMARRRGRAIAKVTIGAGPQLKFYYHGELWSLGLIPFSGRVEYMKLNTSALDQLVIVGAGPLANMLAFTLLANIWGFFVAGPSYLADLFMIQAYMGLAQLLPFWKKSDGSQIKALAPRAWAQLIKGRRTRL